MKKKIIYLVLLSFAIASCSKIFDVNPTDSISNEISIKDKAGIEHALTGTYNALQSIGLYGRNYVIVGDLAADNLIWTGTSQDYGQITNKPIPAENGIIDAFWSASYDGINRANNILYKLPTITDATEKESAQYEGEALFIRSLLYYNLVTHFGGVPLKILPTLDLSSINAARNSKEEVYTQIINDLISAKEKLAPQNLAGRANSFSASALLARVYMSKFFDLGHTASAENAITESTRVINEGGFDLEPTYAVLFSSSTSYTESIFEVVYDLQNYNRLAQYFYTRNLIGRYEIAPTSDFIQSFETEDVRLASTVAYDDANLPYGIKYNDVSGGTDRVFVLRLAEMYLLRAEALAYTNGDIANIQADINKIRNRAGLANTSAASLDELKLAIENECRHEFAFEGHRWSDLVRTKRATALFGIDPNYTLFPIPLSEMQTNNKMEQNQGY